jgi:hypothetical protein
MTTYRVLPTRSRALTTAGEMMQALRRRVIEHPPAGYHVTSVLGDSIVLEPLPESELKLPCCQGDPLGGHEPSCPVRLDFEFKLAQFREAERLACKR